MFTVSRLFWVNSFSAIGLALLIGNFFALLPVSSAQEGNTGLQQVPAFLSSLGGTAAEVWNKIKCGIFKATANAAKMMNIEIPESSPLAKLTICSDFTPKVPGAAPPEATPALLVVKGQPVSMIQPTGLDEIKAAFAAARITETGRLSKAMLESQFATISVTTDPLVNCDLTPQLCPRALVMMANQAAEGAEGGEGGAESGGGEGAGEEEGASEETSPNKIIVILLKAGKGIQQKSVELYQKAKSIGRK